jgi:ABC-type multidrug transport system fused ATPase/permease subunit
LCFGSTQVVHKALSVGGLVAFYYCLNRLFDPLFFSIDLNARLQRASANVTRIRSVLESKITVPRRSSINVLAPTVFRGRVLFECVQFGYGRGNVVIDDMSLAIAAGERVALVGPSGCGKSTVAKLIARVHDVQAGAVVLDGKDIREMGLEIVRSHVGYVPQRAALFNATLEDNVRLGSRWASKEELHSAANRSLLLPVIERLPRGWAEPLGPSGGLLSGGERQRIAIARTLLRRPRILILDESTAELDLVTETSIFAAINQSIPDATLIIITHRLPAISWVDRIVVMDKGHIADVGTHQTLYGNSKLYTALFCQTNTDTGPPDACFNVAMLN